ncbi:hypothetical protein [Streptomyces sp. NBC_01565]|nr:hypothetical protein [Streptomyces sp. NBC_01565]MCX4546662.1 hypothetical protein [Streptomyces sp. NBC_01565]
MAISARVITDGEDVRAKASSCARYAARVSPSSVYAWERCTACFWAG